MVSYSLAGISGFIPNLERGVPVTELRLKPHKEPRTGTAVTFKPDPKSSHTGIEFDYITQPVVCES